MCAYTVPAGFINTAASVAWNLSAKTGTVYFIKTGQCRFYMAGRTSDGGRFRDSCLVTVRNPFSITGDTLVAVNVTAKLFLAPRPASMASGAMIEWKANGASTITTVNDTFHFSNSVSGIYPIIAAFVDTVHRDTARIDSVSLKIRRLPAECDVARPPRFAGAVYKLHILLPDRAGPVRQPVRVYRSGRVHRHRRFRHLEPFPENLRRLFH